MSATAWQQTIVYLQGPLFLPLVAFVGWTMTQIQTCNPMPETQSPNSKPQDINLNPTIYGPHQSERGLRHFIDKQHCGNLGNRLTIFSDLHVN